MEHQQRIIAEQLYKNSFERDGKNSVTIKDVLRIFTEYSSYYHFTEDHLKPEPEELWQSQNLP